MADTELDPVVEDVVDEVDEPEVVVAPEPTPIELEAMQEGWTPKEKWTGDPKLWRDAAAWIDRGQILRVNSSLRSELKKMEGHVAQAFKQGKEIAEANYAEKLQELKLIRRRALEEQDFTTADNIEDKIDELKENKNKAQAPRPVAETPPEYHTFIQRNPWYLTNKVMQYTANAIGAEFAAINKDASPADLYWHVENAMKTNHPQLYGGATVENKALPGTEKGGQSKSNDNSASEFSSIKKSMSSQEVDIMKTLIRQEVFKNEAEYLKEYARLNK